MAITRSNTWVGFGANIGGMLFAAGVESMLGMIMRADGAARTDVSSTAIRFGLGLGGSGGAVILAVLNATTLDYFRTHRRQDGWGMAVALPEGRVALSPGVVAAIERIAPALHLVARSNQAGVAAVLNQRNVDLLYNIVQAVISGFQTGRSAADGTPGFFAIGTPLGGGAELSAYITAGYVSIGNAGGLDDARAQRRGMAR